MEAVALIKWIRDRRSKIPDPKGRYGGRTRQFSTIHHRRLASQQLACSSVRNDSRFGIATLSISATFRCRPTPARRSAVAGTSPAMPVRSRPEICSKMLAVCASPAMCQPLGPTPPAAQMLGAHSVRDPLRDAQDQRVTDRLHAEAQGLEAD